MTDWIAGLATGLLVLVFTGSVFAAGFFHGRIAGRAQVMRWVNGEDA